MYCSHCGKKVGDAMLFCPFCGEEIVIPEQDDAKDEAPVKEEAPTPESNPTSVFIPLDEALESASKPPEPGPTEAQAEPESPAGEDAAAELLDWSRKRRDHLDEWARPEEPFQPLKLEEAQDKPGDWREQIAQKKQSAAAEKKPPRMEREAAPVRLEGSAPKLELDVEGAKPKPTGKKPRKHANTLVPPKTMDPGDIFMDDKPSAYDDDPYDDEPADDYRQDFVYEDDEESSFFMRHLRGFVGLALFLILMLMFVIYAFSKAGQITLARANLAWSPDAYSTLGYQNYQSQRYDQAGLFYERALQRSPDNYSYASSAAMAYLEAGQTEKSAAMLKRCVEIDPTKLEPYIYLLKLYPDASTRPWDVTQLLQQGYQQTGDSRLNVTG